MCKPILTDTICGLPVAQLKKPTPAEIAGLFANLTDDDMAEFFVAVRLIADTWDGSPGMTFWSCGGHLAECPGAQDSYAIGLIEDILSGFKCRQKRLNTRPLAERT